MQYQLLYRSRSMSYHTTKTILDDNAIQIGMVFAEKHLNKPEKGHLLKSGEEF